ncbi:uncharacterized protein [Littorina saxatilis]|uniref:Uncharacterized protein n=1 Tax=Littorina saxatilis TaxID=31220 RepID=A0AAN9AM76_9CAEN
MANVGDEPEQEFILVEGLEKIKDETSELTDAQKEEEKKIVGLLNTEYQGQKDEQTNKSIMRLRQQFVHVHGTLGGERAVDAVMATKGAQMAQHGMTVCVLNLNFLKRLQTRALFTFVKENLLKEDPKAYALVFLKIQEEDADEVDRKSMLDDLQDKAEDAPLFVLTDETCKEAERIDDVITDLTQTKARFHFWSSSAFAHGTPDAARRYRLASQQECPATVRQVMDMIDIDDDDVDITGPHHVPLRRVIFPFSDGDKNQYNIRLHLDELPVRLISHNRTHEERDVWECEKCGQLLATYLHDDIGIGKTGLDFNEVFIVGSIKRFESSVSISGLQVSLLDKDIVSEVLFCRRAVKIQDILKTMNKIVVSDSVSMRGVDKKIVIVIPSPREKEQQEQIEKEMRERKQREEQEEKEMQLAEEQRAAEKERLEKELAIFPRPIPINPDDEDVLCRREHKDDPDSANEFIRKDPVSGTLEGNEEEEEDDEDSEEKDDEDEEEEGDLENLSDDDVDFSAIPEEEIPLPPRRPRFHELPARLRYSAASHQGLLRRAINSLNRFDKDMILDLFTDAPRHAVVFHFAEDD